MLKLYYKIWVDCITKIRNADSLWWQYKSMVSICFPSGIAFMFFTVILEHDVLGTHYYKLGLENYLYKPWCDLLELFILYFLPFIIINYFLIFYNKKYESLLKKYEYNNGRYILTFILSCMSIPILFFLKLILFGQVHN